MTDPERSRRSYIIGAQPHVADALPPALYLVPTPIGHLGDVTLRALATLAAADVIYCEDTRVTAKLLERYGIRNKLRPYHDHNAQSAGASIIEEVRNGLSVALASDAGTPLISDPGYPLVRDFLAQGLKVEALPGASAVLPALQLSGLPADRFAFLGFLPQKRTERLRFIEEFSARSETVIVYESPYRIVEALEDLGHVLGGRVLSVSREISKLHEESLRGDAASIMTELASRPSIKGEFVVVIAGADPQSQAASEADIEDAITQALAELPASKAAASVAKALGVARDDVYARILKRKNAT